MDLHTVVEDETSDGVTVSSGSVRVEFSSFISGSNVHLGEISGSSDLDVVRLLSDKGD